MAELYTVRVPLVDLMETPVNGEAIGRRDSQMLYGETFRADMTEGNWASGVSETDGYRGYVDTGYLTPFAGEATHVVTRLLSHIYTKPDFKTRPVLILSFLSRVRLTGKTKDGFAEMENGGWMFAGHLAPVSDRKADHTETALMFLQAPYLYGGRTSLGIDCSGLVQLALMRSGIPCPRDSDQQQEAVGKSVDAPQRGDLVFFKGHVGIMLDGENILNATARTMDVRVEKLSELEKIYGGILAVKRL